MYPINDEEGNAQRREKEKTYGFFTMKRESHKQSGFLHLRWRYILLGPPVHTIIQSIIVSRWYRVKKMRKRGTGFNGGCRVALDQIRII
jgi:hypothetical protein